jgi:tRNA(Ile)-lysidine synthase
VRFVLECGDESPHPRECFDADALGEGLFVRTWENGDRFQPLGMSDTKKLQDFFVDEKVPRLKRGRVPLVCTADGRIAWVVGQRIAEPFKVRGETHRILRLRAEAIQG